MDSKYQVAEKDDEDFENMNWMKVSAQLSQVELKSETFFVLVNTTRKTMRQGEQVFTYYGQRTNSTLLTNWNFCLQNNMYDSIEFKVNLDVSMETPPTMEDMLI